MVAKLLLGAVLAIGLAGCASAPTPVVVQPAVVQAPGPVCGPGTHLNRDGTVCRPN